VGAAVETGDRAPRFEVVDTDYGVLIGARRAHPRGWYWRITQFLLPFHTMPPADIDEPIVQSHIWVPMDDTHVVNWMVTWHTERPLTPEEIAVHASGQGAHVCEYSPATPEPYGDIRTAANRDNDYHMDWEAHRTRMYCGIPGFGVQDQAIQESQGPIVDRGRERLGSSDSAIIQVRKRLMTAARALRDRGTPPPGADPEAYLVRSTSVVLPAGASWVEGAMSRIVVRPGRPLIA
jgi:phthalate 4,5-dioxygenase